MQRLVCFSSHFDGGFFFFFFFFFFFLLFFFFFFFFFLDQPKFWHALILYGSHVQARRSSKTKTGRGGATASWSRSRVPRCAIQAAANRWVMPPLGPATGISV
jgi:hypothetical protein